MDHATYAKAFAAALKKLHINDSTHAARHAFATIQSILQVAIPIIGKYMLHAKPEYTTPAYIHPLSAAEVQIIMKHPELFIPISPHTKLVSSPLTAHSLLE